MTGPPTRRDWRDQLAELPVPQRLQLLRAHSGLPGPRANLTLLDAAADLADPAFVAALLAADDEYLTSCGAAGLGTLAAAGGADPQWPARLHQLARDERWRVREGVTMALQRLGDADLADGGRRLAELTDAWSAEPDPLVRRPGGRPSRGSPSRPTTPMWPGSSGPTQASDDWRNCWSEHRA